MHWGAYFKDMLPGDSNGLVCVIGNNCNQTMTYMINGGVADYLGPGDLHNPKYNHLEIATTLSQVHQNSKHRMHYSGVDLDDQYCPYYVKLYPSVPLEEKYTSADPIVFSIAAVLIFTFTSMIFLLYDCLVERRQRKVLQRAIQSTAIVSSLFPSAVRDRLFATQSDNEVNEFGKGDKSGKTKATSKFYSPKHRLQNFLREGPANYKDENFGGGQNKAIAELFPETTVMFADIAGFTAWSSVREPSQVFTLLEAIYSAFDAIAHKRGVFKVETIGDSYVAVAGLPDPHKDHAVVMVRFARDCREKMSDLTKKLEVVLGPDTGDLRLRFGLNSGQVTAGVLRGERARFQLFGDTVNTAARMESTGEVNRIQVTQATADLLVKAGKQHWVTPREDLVTPKGKGSMQTYWAEPYMKAGYAQSATGSESASHCQPKNEQNGLDDTGLDDRTCRLIDWNVEMLSRLTKQIIARRGVQMLDKNSGHRPKLGKNKNSMGKNDSVPDTIVATHTKQSDKMVLDEVVEIIELPAFDAAAAKNQPDPATIELDEEVVHQLRDLVTTIASMYNDNPFHNFEHASHVTMSVSKLLSRIVAPDISIEDGSNNDVALTLHDHTYGITSDPLTQFACVFSALIHDADHPGVPNAQLIKEKAIIASCYKGKSIAEQNSVDLAWALFSGDRFTELRETLCPTTEDMARFRQLVVNSVMATDIMDKDLKQLRNNRWEKAFSGNEDNTTKAAINRKATIVIEHLIQASDVAHTMQHWHVYRRWNERLFREMYKAYESGRSEKNPADSWYEGELGFFDYYIIPLTKKLSDCGVFGVSSDEYLNYALKNREEWEHRGREVVVNLMNNVAKAKP